MAEDPSCSSNTSSTNQPDMLTEIGQHHPGIIIKGDHAARDATVTPPHIAPEIGDAPRLDRVSAGIRPATVLLGELCARGESDSSGVAAECGPDRSEAGEAGANPDLAAATSSQFGKITSDGTARASSVWDLDSLSDEEDDTSDSRGGQGEMTEVPEVAEHDRGGPEGRVACYDLPHELGKRGGEAFHPPQSSPKRARVDDVKDGVCARSDGSRVDGVARESRDGASPVRVVVAQTEANKRARQLMPPPPPNVGRAKMRHRRSRVTLMHSPRYQRLCGLLERNSRRDDLLYALLGASGLAKRLSVIAPARASGGHLCAYHDRSYVLALKSPPPDAKALEEYGLVDDCEVFEELFDYCCAVAGASIHAAERLCKGEADVAINWGGGRHHAKKCEASGFCYVNDCVLAVLHLIKAFSRVLTIDIDVHHGDGVQEAFYMSDKVMTLSFHHLAKGFFPGAGHCSETGAGSGRGFNLNVPLKEGCGDASFCLVFTRALSAVMEGFQPEAVVILCGADTLSSDPLGPFNLTSAGIRACVAKLVALNLPLLMLGGGGYCPTDTARLWTDLTAAAIGPAALAALPATVPDHAYFPLYGPDFRMATRKKMLPDRNDEVYLDRLCDFVTRAGRGGRGIREGRKAESFREYVDNGNSW